MKQDPLTRDLTRTVFAVLIIGGLIAASVWILRPFLAATIWAAMIVVTTWPIHRGLQSRLWGKRWLATTIMTAALLLVFVAPFSAAIGTIVANAGEIVDWTSRFSEVKLPQPPEFVEKIPVIGDKAATVWREYADKGSEELADIVKPYATRVASWFVAEVGNFGLVTLQFLLTVVIAAILYMTGDDGARWVRRFGRRLAGERGDQVVRLAGQAVRGVALGVVVTALAQSVLGGIGLAIAGVPFAAVLTAVMFMLALAQIGPLPVLLGGLAFVAAGQHRLVRRAAYMEIIVGSPIHPRPI
jgi:predicted PurR-regulated permease PerM